ncbi:MAG: hypothetical protein LUD01_11580, partial [Clostridiales bacterium]|nr:hypothetical protein [Clostridiales bacterium]
LYAVCDRFFLYLTVKPPGTATITITGTGSYTGTLTYTFSITKQSVEIPTIESTVYNGEYQAAEIPDSDLYEVNDEGGGTDTGTYTVALNLTDSENYQWSDGSEEIIQLDFVIEPREVKLEWTAPESLVYDGYAKMPTVTLGNVLEGDSFDETVELSEGYTDGVDNVNAGCSFTCTVTELYNDNYCLPSDATSPVYTITAREISSSDFTIYATYDEGFFLEITVNDSMMGSGEHMVSDVEDFCFTITGTGNYTGVLYYEITETENGYECMEYTLSESTQAAMGLLFVPFVLGEVCCYAKRKRERKKGE